MSFLDVVKRSIGATEKPSPPPRSKNYQTNESKKSNKTHSESPRGRAVECTRSTAASPPKENDSSPRRSVSTTRSRFSQLSCEITQFHKMVRELEELVNKSSETPEDQWRTRLVLRSAEEADLDIGKKIRHQEHTVRNVYDPNVRASYMKLKRDFKRAHESFKTLSRQYKKRQQDAIAQLEQEHGWASQEEIRTKFLAQQEEEFFYRAMRERESEIKNMNESMHKVNNIYQELGRIVQDQQEQIDKVEDHICDAKATTRAGVDRLQQRFPYCGNVDLNGSGKDKRERPAQIRTEEEFRWSMPFETMGEDIKEVVQKDIMGLGSDIISLTRSASMRRASSVLQCSSTSIEQFADDEDSIH